MVEPNAAISVLDLVKEDELFLQFSILSPISESAAPSILVISSIIWYKLVVFVYNQHATVIFVRKSLCEAKCSIVQDLQV